MLMNKQFRTISTIKFQSALFFVINYYLKNLSNHMQHNNSQRSIKQNQKANKYYELYVINANKIKELQKVVTTHLQTISRLLEENKGIRQQKSDALIFIKELQNKLSHKNSSIKKLEDLINKKTNEYSILKKQEQDAAKLFIKEINILKSKSSDNQKFTQALQNQIEIIYERILALLKSNNNNSKLDQSISINSILSEINSSCNSNNSNILSNSVIIQSKSLQNLINKLEIKYKEMTECVVKYSKEIRNFEKKISQLQDKHNLTISREKHLNEQIKLYKEQIAKMKQNNKSMDDILKKCQQQKTQIARKYQIQFQKIKKNTSNKSNIQQLKQQKIILLHKIEQLQQRIKHYDKQNLQIKEINIKQSSNMLQQIKKLQKQFQEQIQKKNQQIKLLKKKK